MYRESRKARAVLGDCCVSITIDFDMHYRQVPLLNISIHHLTCHPLVAGHAKDSHVVTIVFLNDTFGNPLLPRFIEGPDFDQAVSRIEEEKVICSPVAVLLAFLT